MTGQWSETNNGHGCLEMSFEDGSVLYYNDIRHFGTLKIITNQELQKKLSSLGWNPLMTLHTSYLNFLRSKLKSEKQIGELLLDQSIFCGVGNYIRAEALFQAKINPFTSAKNLTNKQIDVLCEAVRDVMIKSYHLQGASFLTHKTSTGEKGNYSNFFQVYGQTKTPQHLNVEKRSCGGRSIFWCPEVQG